MMTSKTERSAAGGGWRGVSLENQPNRSAITEDVQPNIDVLREAVMDEARAEARKILDEARAEAQSIYQQTESEVSAEGEAIIQRAQQQAETTRSQAIALAKIEAQKLKLRRREQILARIFDQVRQRLAQAPQWDDYEHIARALVWDAIHHLDTDNALVRADVETRKVLTNDVLADLASKHGIYLRAGDPLTRGTGVVVETADRHRRYDNTLETRLARLQETLRAQVYRILSETEQTSPQASATGEAV